MDAEKSSLNPSSLLDLKAELHKRYESFQRGKLAQKSEPSKSTSLKYKGQQVRKDKKTILKVPLKSSDEINEEDLALKKSQLALEAKAKLYEKITSNNILIDDEDNEKYLVDFQRKVLYDTPTPVPGKTKIDGKESAVKESADGKEERTAHSSFYEEVYGRTSIKPKFQTDKLEDSQGDQPIHYQNVQFNEVRDHGTGYFAFSMDESKRKEQMEELNKLRQETEEQRLIAQRMQRKRKTKLEARLAKVCERRNIDKSVIQNYTVNLENTEDKNENQNVDLSSIPLPETLDVQEKKVIKIRPWDKGKTNYPAFVPEKHKTKSQKDWVEDRRSERQSEFAPPLSYS